MRLCQKLLTFVIFTCLVSIAPSMGHSDSDQIVIIVNIKSPIQSITTSELKRLFLKQRLNWGNGEKVFPINNKENSKTRQIFRQKVLDMTATEERTYWQMQKVKKGISPPPEFRNVQKAVFSLKGGIGYCLLSEHKPGTSRIILHL